ncbi:hypothetical protein OH146_02510 [Salinibacterium sp. SYSU T00001]|uniref:hypothetical protein n=1 Tax=Homoserinimonas sedimenticola TaxID=2986805 RepID=UPI0022362044|nr:hypothetical protein [Salinibacterium sedimenticola]MCW4384641.1 hypothetical protein [Salinibacterium sedimenticola]
MTGWVPRWNPGPDAAAETLRGIQEWLRSPSLSTLLGEWGIEAPGGLSEGALLEWLDRFSAEHWDFRRGRERNLAVDAELTSRQEAAALRCAPALGLAESWPLEASYDAVIMTGGMVRAGVVKPRFVRRLLDEGIDARHVVFLGAHREFAGDESILAAELGISGADEVDAMTAGVERAFGVRESRRVSAGMGYARTTSVRWRDHEHPRFEVIAAPSRAATTRRADTADTFEHWASRFGGEGTQSAEGRAPSVLVVTTPIYVPYQAAVAVEVLGIRHGMRVETVGVDATASDLGEFTQRFLPQHHLQELRSAVRGIRSLHERLQHLA